MEVTPSHHGLNRIGIKMKRTSKHTRHHSQRLRGLEESSLPVLGGIPISRSRYLNGGCEDVDGFIPCRNGFIVGNEILKVQFDGLSSVSRRLLDSPAVRDAARKQRDHHCVSPFFIGNQIDLVGVFLLSFSHSHIIPDLSEMARATSSTVQPTFSAACYICREGERRLHVSEGRMEGSNW